MKKITEAQREIFAVIERLTEEKGYAPTIREIAIASGRTSTYCSWPLSSLGKTGFDISGAR